MGIYHTSVRALDGRETSLRDYEGDVLLVVNVASKCGFTPQYESLQRLQSQYHSEGFSVLGFPCNQFRGQEPGTAAEIAEFCSTKYGVTFPLFEKTDVNGPNESPVYAALKSFPDSGGEAGDVKWNFEKFLVGRDGETKARFRSKVAPDAPEVVAAIEKALRSA